MDFVGDSGCEIAVRIAELIDRPCDHEAELTSLAHFLLDQFASQIEALATADDLTLLRAAKAVEDSQRCFAKAYNQVLLSSGASAILSKQPIAGEKGMQYQEVVDFAKVPATERRARLLDLAARARAIAASGAKGVEFLPLLKEIEVARAGIPYLVL